VDKEAGRKPKLVTPPAPAAVGTAVRHIAQDELDAYISGRLSGVRLDNCRNHLDACQECRAALEDLRTFKASAVGLSQASSLKRELDRRQRQRQLKSAATILVAAAVVAAIGMVGWNKFGKAWVHSATVVIASAQTNATRANQSHGAAGGPPSQAAPVTASVAAFGAAQPQGAQAAVAARAQTSVPPQSVSHAAITAQAQSPMQSQTVVQSRGAAKAGNAGTAQPAEGSTSFALLGPFGDEVTDDRPEFAWQPLAGASKYSIIIVDEGLRPIAHTRLKTTTWRPKKPLRRGRGYLWQVTAILKNGTKVMATGPTSPEARIRITAPGK